MANIMGVDDLSIEIVDGGLIGAVMTLGEFFAQNEFDPEEAEDIRDAIWARRDYQGGGGAAPAWRIKWVMP